ncbi:Transcriptional accessory protein Tex/SPT6 [Rhodanobacter sp. Root179]|uniref:Tex family protein n=1 Tax=unclassified Rhodanobacter TaxID=2621553 RepID=UPI0006FB13F7|nr:MULTISPECIES: Tex family protein [unclassified Rhodanobacter]KRB46424.1 RNA-binding transcriptional accessory protein [Rhodanobacter sp. Root179]QRP64133.1 RNA-binding transcriptional accessory protein [Rhodanobacter sp. FDAARGOS 1247]
MQSIEQRIATDIAASTAQVRAAVELLDGGATVPFIARYRKEVTGGLDDTQLRLLEERLRYLRELEERRAAILASVEEQGKLDDTLKADLLAADTKARLEDLYLPFKPKRRTKAQIAREAGLEPLALGLRDDPTLTPEAFAESFVDAEKGIADVRAALDGARAILMESIAEDAHLVGELRDWLWTQGQIRATVVEGKQNEGAKFRDYFDHVEPIGKIPSHRLLALMRARNEGVIEIELAPAADSEQGHAEAEGRVAAHANIHNRGRAADAWLRETVRLTWRVKLHLHLTLDLFGRVREGAEDEAIRVFGDNLKDLMLAAPAGAKTVMGLDPGIRTGCKVAVVDATGKVLATDTIYPLEPKRQWNESLASLARLCKQHHVDLISIGNGTGSRETDKLAGELIKGLAKADASHTIAKIVVSEAGASVYSASETAAREFPDLDVTLRGAVSIARRLQDPLAELVKIEPKAIGVGQYQHDVNQIKLARALDARVEDCVNAVGVDVNTASAALLSRVAGLSASVAENVVKHRDANGPFANRKALLKVPRLGDKAFEQCAGFLRVPNGDNPLDASSVHPEAYPVVERIIAQCGREVRNIIGDTGFLRGLKVEQFTDEKFGVPTVRDILKELEKPGRDPRPEFVAPSFAEGVEDVKDLRPGMILEGRVTNVAAFGAFVDIGVHQDGLVHVSALSHTFVKDPRDAVKAGDIVKVKVMEVDLPRQRIGLSMRLDDEPGQTRERGAGAAEGRGPRDGRPPSRGGLPKPTPPPASGAFADAFAKARKN